MKARHHSKFLWKKRNTYWLVDLLRKAQYAPKAVVAYASILFIFLLSFSALYSEAQPPGAESVLTNSRVPSYASSTKHTMRQDDGNAFSVENPLPNIIFILADDLGYGDLSCYGAESVRTPHLDALANEGLRFTSYHSAASICSPARAALLTGAYPQRCGLYMGINPSRAPHWFLGLNPAEITIAEQFKRKDYATLLVGKWHLGTEEVFSPLRQGFDAYYGMPCNYNHDPRFFDGNQIVFEKTPLDSLTLLYTNRILQFIDEYAGKPFFLLYAHNYPHTPYKPGVRFAGSSNDGIRGDVIQEFDWSVGRIVEALRRSGLLDNTLIVFTSDNGPVRNRYARPFRGTKFVTLEGGHRVPLIISWMDGLAESGVVDTRVNGMDFFPTFSELIDVSTPEDRIYDGLSLVPLFAGEALARQTGTQFVYYNCENLQAISYKNWKLHLPRTGKQIPFWDKNRQYPDTAGYVLYNMENDSMESLNLADKYPEIVHTMSILADSVREELGEFGKRGKGQRPTGTLFPAVPVVSHPRDWQKVPAELRALTKREQNKNGQ